MTDPGGGELRAGADAFRSFTELIKPFTDPALSEFGEYVRDKIRFLRWKNSIRVLERARRILEELGLEPRPVSPKLLVSVLEGVGLEGQSELVERWAGLLASGAAGEKVTPAFPAILSQMSRDDVVLLEIIWNHSEKVPSLEQIHQRGERAVFNLAVREQLLKDDARFILVAENLCRLSLLYRLEPSGLEVSESKSDYAGLALTVLGLKFVQACHGPRTAAPGSTKDRGTE